MSLSSATVDTYHTAVDGSLTHDGTATAGSYLRDMAISPDGSHLFTASQSPHQFTGFSLPGLAQSMILPGTAYPSAVAISPDGTRVAGGFNSSGGVDLYDANTGTVLWKRYAATGVGPNGAWSSPFVDILPGSVVFSPGGSQVLALAADEPGHVSLFRSVLAPAATTLGVSIPAVAYGHAYFYLTAAPKHALLRFTATFATDSHNHGSSGTSRSFQIG